MPLNDCEHAVSGHALDGEATWKGWIENPLEEKQGGGDCGNDGAPRKPITKSRLGQKRQCKPYRGYGLKRYVQKPQERPQGIHWPWGAEVDVVPRLQQFHQGEIEESERSQSMSTEIAINLDLRFACGHVLDDRLAVFERCTDKACGGHYGRCFTTPTHRMLSLLLGAVDSHSIKPLAATEYLVYR